MHTEPWDVPTSPPTDTTPRRRRWVVLLLAVLLVLATGAAVAAALVASDQREAAAAWQERAEALELQRDEVADDRAAVAEQLNEAVAALTTSETDVARLEDRVRTLAEEKARAEDTATTVSVERDVFVELSEMVAEATGALDSCVTRLFELQEASVAAFNAAAAGQQVDVDALNERAAVVRGFCEQARSAAADAEAAADQLRRS